MLITFFIWILHFINLAKGLHNTKILRYRRNSSVSRLCPAGCATCSTLNGCLSCKPRLFFHLELDGMRQRGTCLSSCPRGHYGMRSPYVSTCTRCKKDCASCFSENFCIRCHPGHFLFRGKCESSCPNGLTPNTALRECTECSIGCEVCVRRNTCGRCRADLYFLHGQCHLTCPREFEPDVQLMQCLPLESHSSLSSKCTVQLGNGQIGVHVFGEGACGPTDGERSHVPDKFCDPQVSPVTCVHMCQRSGSVSSKRDQRVQRGCKKFKESPS